MLIIDDSNYKKFALEPDETLFGRGRIPRDFSKEPYGSLPYAAKFNIKKIPRSDWDAMIEEKDAKKQWLTDYDVPIKMQSRTLFCWCFAPVHCVEIKLVEMGCGYVPLSPASVACRVNGFRNQGGWAGQAVDQIVRGGINAESEWPGTAIDRRYDTQQTRQTALLNIATEWLDLPARDFDALATCVLLNIPVMTGHNWWGHEVTSLRLVKIGRNAYGIMIDNSWDVTWGDKGRAVLEESKATPDDALAITVPKFRGPDYASVIRRNAAFADSILAS